MQTSSVIYRYGNNGRGILGGVFNMGGELYGLSNNHVIADINACNVGDPIFDASGAVIGSLSHWVVLNSPTGLNLVDVALFRFNASTPATWVLAQPGVSKPTSFATPVQDGYVYIVRSDGSTRSGYISIPYTSQALDFILCDSHFLFTHLIEITPFDNEPFAVPGDSGSVAFSNYNNMAIGVVMGSAKGGIKGYAAPFVNGILNYYPLTI